MKKSFMTRVLAVSLSAAMAFSMSSANSLVAASAASTVNLKTTFKTLKVNQTYKMTLKKNTLNWKITKVTTTNKKICTVYGKTASSVMLKGKGVGRAKITVKVKTTKRKYPKNIKNMKCTVNVKAADPSTEDIAFTATAAANSPTEVRVNFSKAVDAAAVENFKITEENVSVSDAKLSDDKKSVVLTIAGAEYSKNYELTVTGIKVGGAVQADQKAKFTTPSPEVLYPTELTAEKTILKSDGQATTTITFKITDAQGKPLTDKGMEVRFTTNLGKFATDRVSIQNGEARVMYTSEALSQNHTAVITATIIEAPADTTLIGTTATTSISLMPNPEQIDDTSIGATLTSITAPTADRIYAYFNKKVNAEDFKVGDKPNTKKFDATIKSGLDNGYGEGSTVVEHDIVGILPVDNDETALQLLVDQPMVDNSIVKVDFENKTETNGIYIPKNTAYCKLTDARQPAVVSVNTEDGRTIKIEFSEAVLRDGDCNGEYEKALAAENLDNYQIDGIQLSNEGYWGKFDKKTVKEETTTGADATTLKRLSEKVRDDENNIKGEIKVGRYGDRHVVTIKLGRKQYLKPGTHRLSIANVGDWAAKTDKERNIVSTEGFNFDVAESTEAPSFTVKAMSPEQYLLDFTSEIVPTSDSDRITTDDSSLLASVLKLEVKNANGTWSEISNSKNGLGKNSIMVSRVKEDDTLTNQYLVEVMNDWTKVYNTSGTNDNYYRHNYRLSIDAEKIQNPANGLKNPALAVEITDDIIRTPDGQSPEIDKIEDAEGNIGSYNVFMSKPVKLSGIANKEGLTPSQKQSQSSTLGVAAPEAQFVHSGDGRTVAGIIATNEFMDAYDQIINVAPATDLSNGDWTLYVRSISDDVGNTAATLSTPISIDKPVTETDFKVVWAAVGYDEGAYANSKAADYGTAIKEAEKQNRQGNCIYVKFNKPVTLFGSSTNAQSISNYTLNGAPLPTGTEIRAHIKGYDDAVGLDTGITDSVTIVLPKDRFSGSGNSGSNRIYTVSSLNTMLNISKTVTCSTTNELLGNGGMIRIPFQFGSGKTDAFKTMTTDKIADKGSPYVAYPIESLNAKSDAVWGNHEDEIHENYKNYEGQGGKIEDSDDGKSRDYYEKVKAALDNEQYRKVILTHDIDLNSDEAISVFGRGATLRINRAVDLDLNGYEIKGNVVVTTDNLADRMYIYSSSTNKGKIIGKDNGEAVLTVNAGKVDDFYLQNVKVTRSSFENSNTVSSPVILLNDVWVNTFVIAEDSRVEGAIHVADSDGFGLENKGSADNITGNIIVNGSGNANLKGNFERKYIEFNQAAKLYLTGAKIDGTRIWLNATDTKLFIDKTTQDHISTAVIKPTITAAAKDIKVYLEDSSMEAAKNIKFVKNVGCNFIQIDDKGNTTPGNIFADITVADESNVARALRTVDILPSGMKKVSSDEATGNVTITTGALTVTEAGLKLGDLRKQIRKNFGAMGFGDYSEYLEVEFKLNSTNLVETSGDYLKVKKDINEVTEEDKLTVRLTYDGQSIIRTITIRK